MQADVNHVKRTIKCRNFEVIFSETELKVRRSLSLKKQIFNELMEFQPNFGESGRFNFYTVNLSSTG